MRLCPLAHRPGNLGFSKAPTKSESTMRLSEPCGPSKDCFSARTRWWSSTATPPRRPCRRSIGKHSGCVGGRRLRPSARLHAFPVSEAMSAVSPHTPFGPVRFGAESWLHRLERQGPRSTFRIQPLASWTTATTICGPDPKDFIKRFNRLRLRLPLLWIQLLQVLVLFLIDTPARADDQYTGDPPTEGPAAART
jgi:hypothetical protein